MNSSSNTSELASCGATTRPTRSTLEVATMKSTLATTIHATRIQRMRKRAPTTRFALSPSACRGCTFSNRTSGSASAQRTIVRASVSARPMPMNATNPAAITNSRGRCDR